MSCVSLWGRGSHEEGTWSTKTLSLEELGMCKGQKGKDVSLLEVKTLSLKMWPDGLHVLVTSRHSHF